MTALMVALDGLAAPWAAAYNDSTMLQTTVACAHVGGMLLAGGLAIAADRTTLRATRDLERVPAHVLPELAAVHRPVLVALAVTVLSGVLMLAADLDALLGSPVLWLKLGLFGLLLINGAFLQVTERRLARGARAESWSRLRRFSVVSRVLWFGVALAGTALLNVS
jgi:hypothetical protein